MLQQAIDNAISASTDVDWAISIRDASGRELADSNADRAMKTASVGKVLLLIEVARQRDAGELSGATMLRREPDLMIADSGLWQHLQVDSLSVDDLCVLIASVSDNLATNVVLKKVGLPALRELSESLGLVHSGLLDYVRNHRGPDNPSTLSTGSASELSRLMGQLSRDELISPVVSEQVNTWLATGMDLSMVASAFGLDPLAHVPTDRNILIRNKTGSDPGVRADVGTIQQATGRYSYAVIANWDAANAEPLEVVLAGMNSIGAILRSAAESE
ncbi:serine hydrolase [Mycobacterium sp.]|uniref:serine hydrolase n=1 Tax=Mycobacterium sp. TaxID=1785 RepID=UPI003D0F5E71